MLKWIVIVLSVVGFAAHAHALERVGPAFRINATSLNSGDQVPAIAALANGGFVAAWSNGMVLNAQVYSAEGARVGSEIEITRSARNQAAPSVAGLRGGGFVVIWEGDANPDFSVRGQRFTARGALLGAGFQVIPLMEDVHNPSVAALPDGGFVVVWNQDQNGSEYIFGQRFSPAAARVGQRFKVSTARVDHPGNYPEVAGFEDGSFVVIWFACCTNEGIVGQRYSPAGARVGGEFNVLAAHDGSIAPAIAALKNGGFVVVGFVAGLVKAQRFNANGSPVGGVFRVNHRSTFKSALLRMRVAPLADGGFVFTWDGILDNRFGVFGQTYNADGGRLGGEFKVNASANSGSGHSSSVAGLRGGDFVVTWYNTSTPPRVHAIFGQRFSP